jgi:hemolysin D
MRPSSAATATAKVIPLKPLRPRRSETEFLPAALEIIETPASPVGRAIAGTIIGFMAVAIGWACIGKVDIIATAQGRIIPTGKSKSIQPFETGVVRRIAVSDGSIVLRGDILVELDPTSDQSDETRLIFALAQDRLDIARLRALLDDIAFASPSEADARMVAMARRQMDAQAAQQAAKLDGLDRQIAGKQAEGREVSAAIEKIDAGLPLITEQRDIRKALLQNQYGSRLAYLQVQQQLVEGQHELEGQKQKREETGQALAALDRQKAETTADYRKGLLTDLAKAEVSSNEHEEDRKKAVLKRELRTLRAPVDGTVQQLAVHTLGGVVTPAQQLMVIVPKGTGLEIEATLPNKDVGFVHKGQDVEIKVEAFTFTRYGLLHGKVTSLSQDVIAPQDSGDTRGSRDKADGADTSDEQDRQAKQPTYVAHVAVAATGIETENGFSALEPGMSVTAEIKTGRRTVISYLLSPLSRFRQEGMRER